MMSENVEEERVEFVNEKIHMLEISISNGKGLSEDKIFILRLILVQFAEEETQKLINLMWKGQYSK